MPIVVSAGKAAWQVSGAVFGGSRSLWVFTHGIRIVDCFIPEKSKKPIDGLTMSFWGTMYPHTDVPVHPSDHFALVSHITVSD